MFMAFFFRKSCRLEDKVQKYYRPGLATDDNMTYELCLLVPKSTNTHSGYAIIFSLPPQQCLHECTSMSRYIYSACLVHIAWDVY